MNNIKKELTVKKTTLNLAIALFVVTVVRFVAMAARYTLFPCSCTCICGYQVCSYIFVSESVPRCLLACSFFQ